MQRYALRSIFLIFVLALFGACGRVPDNARFIPDDAVAVAGINLRSLSKKIAWNLITGSKLFKEIKRRMPEKNAGDAIIGIENAGFDVTNTFYVYTRPDERFSGGNLVAGLIPLSDAVAWEAYIKLVFPDVAIVQREGRKEAALGAGMYVGWSSNLLIIINATAADDDEESDRKSNPDEVAVIIAEMDKAFKVPATNSIIHNKRFSGFESHNYDLSFYLNYGSMISGYGGANSLEIGGLSLSSAMWKDAVITAGFEFKKGKITGAIDYYLPSKVEEATVDFGAVEADKEMLRRMPKEDIDMLLSMHISPSGVRALLEKTGLFGITNVGLATQGLDVDYVLDAFTGDMAVMMNDFSLIAEIETDPFMGQMMAHKEQKANMSMTYAIGINKKENFSKLLEFAKGGGMLPTKNGYVLPLTTTDSVHLMMDDKYAVISSKRKYATGFLEGAFKGSKMKNAVRSKVYGYPFSLILDMNQLFKEVDPAISSSPRDSAIIAESKKLLDNVSLNGGKYINSAYKFDLEINFLNRDENSILELIDFGMRMNDINNGSVR
jgi:hypothetical protein